MANLKEIRDRISSVKNTRKITEAMRLVAAAKVRRAQEQVLRSRPFADRLARVLENLQSRMRFEDVDAPLLEERPVETITLLAVTGDRGLCGGYNANIIKRTEQRFTELKDQGFNVDLVLIGRKAITYFQNRSYPIRATFTGLEQVPNPAALFLTQRQEAQPAGVVAAPVYEGSRVLLVEIQSLVVPAKGGISRVFSERIDAGRVSRMAAVLEKHLKVRLSDQDIYVNVGGGIRIGEVGIELPLAACLYSARLNQPVPPLSWGPSLAMEPACIVR